MEQEYFSGVSLVTTFLSLFEMEERACSDSIYLFLLRQKDVNLFRLKKVILLKNTNDPNLLRLIILNKEGSRMEGTLDFDSVNLGANFLP